MGLIEDLRRLLPAAADETKQQALSCAATCGESEACAILLENAADPNQFNPDGYHAHCTPLHNAVSSDSLAVVTTLLAGGADTTIKDKMFDSDALGWAR